MAAEMHRYWVRFFGGENGDARPLTFPIPIEWWCTATDLAGQCTICAIVDSTDDVSARQAIVPHWPEARFDEVTEKAPDWRPSADRFPPKRRATPSGSAGPR